MANLVKLLLEAYEDAACSGRPLSSVKAVINPESYSRTYEVNYSPSDESGANAPTMIFKGMGANNLKLKLIVDGTGLVPLDGASDVDDYLDKLKKTVYTFKGDEHRPNYLKVTWGKLVFTGVCKGLTISYSLFNPDGSGLRATVDLDLTESKDFKTKAKEAQKSSPDLTHARTVKAGDNLPLMAYRIYGDSSHYLMVARFNRLNNIWDIKPGDQIYFPPL